MATRNLLKSYFVTNNIPTEGNFAELIDSSLLQAEDGIRKADNGPIELAATQTTGELLRLYGSFGANTAAWTVSLKPSGAKLDLNIADAQSSRLFIKADNGNVGIGTPTPAQKLDVAGGATFSGSVGVGTAAPAARLQVIAADNEVGTNILDVQPNNLTQGVGVWYGGIRKTGTNANSNLTLDAKGNGAVLLNANGGAGNVGIGTAAPDRPLTVQASASAGSELISLKNAGGGTKWHWNLRNTDLNLAETGVQDGRLYMQVGGNVGIGTMSPTAKLHVEGSVNIAGGNTLEFGGGMKKEPNAGKIGYGTFTKDALDIVGAGSQGNNRKIQFWNEGGAGFTGNVGIGTSGPATTLDVRTADNSAAITVGKMDGTAGALYLGNKDFGLRRGFPEVGSNNHVGLYTSGANLYLSGQGADIKHFVLTEGGNVGIGNTNPDVKLYVDGSVKITNKNTLEFGVEEGNNEVITGKISYVHNSLNIEGGGKQASSRKIQFWNEGGAGFSGNVGIGASDPRGRLDVRGGDSYLVTDVTNSNGQTVYLPGHLMLAPYSADNNTAYIQARVPNPTPSTSLGLMLRVTYQGKLLEALSVAASGNVGIGTNNAQYPLHVASAGGVLEAGFRVYNASGDRGAGSYVKNEVSILATNRVVGSEFNATSDQRLKTIVGLSDHAADLALLNRLRITNYTMRDKVQFGNQAFKKLIGQELEEVFSQAVHQHTGFVPDIYASASQVQRQGEALLLTLPDGLPAAATAGQRLKLVGPTGEVLATLAEPAAAGSRQLLVAGANELADTPNEVFIFGLEHADVRTVDYEAVAMLNVSATQALARQVAELHQQNAALNEQNQAQRAQLSELQAALQLLRQQVGHLLREPSSLAQPA